MKHEIGVVIATYNGETYIQEQLASITSQTLKPDLIIVSDGGSTDSTVELCKRTLRESNIKHVILESNRRLSVKENFEKGLKKCDTKYIFFSDQDDYWLPNKLENAVREFKEKRPVLVFCNAFIVNSALGKEGKTLWQKIGYKPKKKIEVYERYDTKLQKELIRHNIVTGMCMAIDGNIKKNIMPFSDHAIHDSWIALMANTLGKTISINSCDVYYRQHGSNAIGTKATIRSSLNHKEAYLPKIKRRYKFMKDLLKKIDNGAYAKRYVDYMKHLNSRILFIEGEKPFMGNLSISDYRKYEYKPMQILFKDTYARMAYNKKNKNG